MNKRITPRVHPLTRQLCFYVEVNGITESIWTDYGEAVSAALQSREEEIFNSFLTK